MKFQLSAPQEALAPFEKKLSVGVGEILLLSGSLLGTWPHVASESSRSRLCRTCLQIVDTGFMFLCGAQTFGGSDE